MPYTSINGFNVYYEESGSGFPLLLLMGLGSHMSDHTADAEFLSRKYRVIIPNYRSREKTDKVRGPYSLKQLALDQAALLDGLGIKNVHILGFSMGGHVAQELALCRPGLISGLVLCFTACRTTSHGMERLKIWKELLVSGNFDLYVRNLFTWIFGRELFDDRQKYLEWVKYSVDSIAAEDKEGLYNLLDATLEFNALDRIHDIKAKTLIINGTRDLIFSPKDIDEMASRIKGSQVVILNSAHAPMGESTEKMHEVIDEFLEGMEK
jgi:3-oxoadipate enol-lactonase